MAQDNNSTYLIFVVRHLALNFEAITEAGRVAINYIIN